MLVRFLVYFLHFLFKQIFSQLVVVLFAPFKLIMGAQLQTSVRLLLPVYTPVQTPRVTGAPRLRQFLSEADAG